VLALVVAGVGVAVIGSRPSDPSIVIPGPSPSGPTPAPTIGPSTGPSAQFPQQITMLVSAGEPFPITVDNNVSLQEAVSLQPGDGATVGPEGIRIATDPDDPTGLIVTWIGIPCERTGTLFVDELAHEILVGRDECAGDTFPLDRIVRLRFLNPMHSAEWTAAYVGVPTPSVGPGEPQPSNKPPPSVAFSFEALDGVGGPTRLDVIDDSGHLVNAVSGQPSDAGQDGFVTAVNLDPRSVRVSWPGSACDVAMSLTVAADFGVTIQHRVCSPDTSAAFRSAILTFDRDVDADTMDLGTSQVGGDWVADGADSAGSRFDLVVTDSTGSLIDFRSLDPAGAGAPGASRVRLDQAGEAIVELVWTGRACDVTPQLTIESTGTRWVLIGADCNSDRPEVVRRVSLTFASPRPVGPIEVVYLPPAT
jgi:hypothetical protein